MRAEGLVARPKPRRRVGTADSLHAEPIAPNRLQRQFGSAGVAVNRVLVGDITYLPTREGFLYLAAVLDLSSRRCVGWAMRDTLEVDLVLSALHMAPDARHSAPGLIFHSDPGCQYASAAHREALAEARMLASMSGKGDCYDNAVAESFFFTLEFELLRHSDWLSKRGTTGNAAIPPWGMLAPRTTKQDGRAPRSFSIPTCPPFRGKFIMHTTLSPQVRSGICFLPCVGIDPNLNTESHRVDGGQCLFE
jgi:hypothetical protein